MPSGVYDCAVSPPDTRDRADLTLPSDRVIGAGTKCSSRYDVCVGVEDSGWYDRDTCHCHVGHDSDGDTEDSQNRSRCGFYDFGMMMRQAPEEPEFRVEADVDNN